MRRAWRAAAACCLALLASGCSAWSLNGPQSTLAPDGPVAHRQMDVFLVTLWVAVGIFAVVGSLFAYCLVRFRAKGDVTADTPLPDQGHGNTMLEMGLIMVSILLVGVIAVPTLTGIFYVGTMPNDKNAVTVNVTGLQWWWKFDYPDLGVSTANEVALPTGVPVRFNLKTADVLHAFWIPRLGGKMDLVPQQDNWLWLQGDVPGLYYGQCAEFCGESHAFMRFRARVLDALDYQNWIANQKAPASPDPALAVEGKRLFMKNQCATCHTIRGQGPAGTIGPDLTHIGSRASIAAGIMDNTEENLIQWIQDPYKHKPGNTMYKAGYVPFKVQMAQDDIIYLAKYLHSLK